MWITGWNKKRLFKPSTRDSHKYVMCNEKWEIRKQHNSFVCIFRGEWFGLQTLSFQVFFCLLVTCFYLRFYRIASLYIFCDLRGKGIIFFKKINFFMCIFKKNTIYFSSILMFGKKYFFQKFVKYWLSVNKKN